MSPEQAAAREEFVFFHPLRVRWSEVDAQGVVFNPNYLGYADIALSEYMRALGYPYPEGLKQHDADLFVVRADVEFLQSAVYDDELELAARVQAVGRTSLRMRMAVLRGDALLTRILMTYVYVRLVDGQKRPTPVPADFVARVERYERTPPERK